MLPLPKSILRKIGRRSRRAYRPFNLQRNFAALSLLSIVVISGAAAIVLTRFITDQLVERDAVVNMEVIQAVADVENLALALPHTHSPFEPPHEHGTEFFAHLSAMPDVVWVAVHGPDRTTLWSSEIDAIGKRLYGNEDLDRALTGELVFELSERDAHDAEEYNHVGEGVTTFVEHYIPVQDIHRNTILGVVEIYKIPTAVLEGIAAGRRLIWSTAAVGSVFLFLMLFWLVRRADTSMRAQQERLVEAETMAAVGEMASGIAHGIRNPLASIRTTAELALEEGQPSLGPSPSHEAAREVILEVDRLERMIRELLLMARQEREEMRALCLAEMIELCARSLATTTERQDIGVSVNIVGPLSPVEGDRRILNMALDNVLSNAVQAMPDGGSLKIALRMADGGDWVELTVADSGKGIPEERLAEVFKPFVSSKSSGLGLGLALTKRIVERHGGTIALASEVGKGTTVTIRLPAGGE
ncbi:MAG: hypothetical protein JSU82_17375 [Rhodospirillales bacterium]|nr:MAG: hypothetical protein JSU82_17375 [Rhodospirillales bacterium]